MSQLSPYQSLQQSSHILNKKLDLKQLESQNIFNPLSQIVTLKSSMKNNSQIQKINLQELIPSQEQITGDISQLMNKSQQFLKRRVHKIDKKLTGELLQLTPYLHAPEKALANKRSTSTTLYPSIHQTMVPRIRISQPVQQSNPNLKNVQNINNNNDNNNISQMFQKDIEFRLTNLDNLPKQFRLQMGLQMSTPQSERTINPMLFELKKSPKIQNSLLFEKKKLHHVFEQQRIQNKIKEDINYNIQGVLSMKEKYLTTSENSKLEYDLDVGNIDVLKEHGKQRKMERVFNLMNQKYNNQWMQYRVPNSSIKRTEFNALQQCMF